MTEHGLLQKREETTTERDVHNVVPRPKTNTKKFTDKSYSQNNARTNFGKGRRRQNPHIGMLHNDYCSRTMTGTVGHPLLPPLPCLAE